MIELPMRSLLFRMSGSSFGEKQNNGSHLVNRAARCGFLVVAVPHMFP
jgi:hypothetical protein